MTEDFPNHYAALGLHENCSTEEVRKAYRLLSKSCHPDLNQDDPGASEKMRRITEAYNVLRDQQSRADYDEALNKHSRTAGMRFGRGRIVDIKEDVFIHLCEFITGTDRTITVKDPANPHGEEIYTLEIPPETPPGKQFRIAREAPFDGGSVIARVKPWPDARFKPRGSDVKCDLIIFPDLAEAGGEASLRGVTGIQFDVDIPANCPRGEVIVVEGEGLPRPRGGRGNLLVRVMYKPHVRTRKESGGGGRFPRRRLR